MYVEPARCKFVGIWSMQRRLLTCMPHSHGQPGFASRWMRSTRHHRRQVSCFFGDVIMEFLHMLGTILETCLADFRASR